MTAPEQPYRAAWNRVHMAVLREELWSPACSDERGWVAPLADPSLAGQITCKVCHPIAMSQNAPEPTPASGPSEQTSQPVPVLRITCTDLETGDTETTEIPAGEYLLLATEPCHMAGVQAYPTKGTHVITIKGRTAR